MNTRTGFDLKAACLDLLVTEILLLAKMLALDRYGFWASRNADQGELAKAERSSCRIFITEKQPLYTRACSLSNGNSPDQVGQLMRL